MDRVRNEGQPHEEFRCFVPYHPGIAVKIVKNIREGVSVSSGKAQSTNILGTEIALSHTNRGRARVFWKRPGSLAFSAGLEASEISRGCHRKSLKTFHLRVADLNFKASADPLGLLFRKLYTSQCLTALRQCHTGFCKRRIEWVGPAGDFCDGATAQLSGGFVGPYQKSTPNP